MVLLGDWFGRSNRQVRTAIEHAAAIVYYRHQPAMPVVETIICDDAVLLRLAFDELFATHTGYAKLDDRIAKTAAKKDELLTVLKTSC